MKLNPDCLRDILLCVEENTSPGQVFYYYSDEPPKELSKYSHEEILYHIQQCDIYNLFVGCMFYDINDEIEIFDLTPKGHQFVDNIRSKNVWNSAQKILKKTGNMSINAIFQVVTSVVSNIVKDQFLS